MTFPEAVEACPPMRLHLRNGLGALESNRARVTIKDTRKISGSVNIETAQRRASAQNHTWDYGIGVRDLPDDLVVWLEVHSANSLHVQSVIDKLDSLLEFLQRHAPHFNEMPQFFVWLATRGVYIAPNSKERRLLNARGLLLRSQRLDLDSLA